MMSAVAKLRMSIVDWIPKAK